jgi:hypothetical protein
LRRRCDAHFLRYQNIDSIIVIFQSAGRADQKKLNFQGGCTAYFERAGEAPLWRDEPDYQTVVICIWHPGGQAVHTRSASGVAGGGCGVIGTLTPSGKPLFDQTGKLYHWVRRPLIVVQSVKVPAVGIPSTGS